MFLLEPNTSIDIKREGSTALLSFANALLVKIPLIIRQLRLFVTFMFNFPVIKERKGGKKQKRSRKV